MEPMEVSSTTFCAILTAIPEADGASLRGFGREKEVRGMSIFVASLNENVQQGAVSFTSAIEKNLHGPLSMVLYNNRTSFDLLLLTLTSLSNGLLPDILNNNVNAILEI